MDYHLGFVQVDIQRLPKLGQVEVSDSFSEIY